MSIFTNDSDLPQHNVFYKSPQANEIRAFTGLFLDLPSYMGMGFETRDYNPETEKEYSGEYVKFQPEDYKWGDNYEYFDALTNMRQFYSGFRDVMNKNEFVWLKTDNDNTAAWLYIDKVNEKPLYMFVLNIDAENFEEHVLVKEFNRYISASHNKLREILSSSDLDAQIIDSSIIDDLIIKNISLGEYKIFEFLNKKD